MIIDSMDKCENKMKNFIIKLLNNCNNLDIIIGSRNKNAFNDWNYDKIVKLELGNLESINTVKLFYYIVENVLKTKTTITCEELE